MFFLLGIWFLVSAKMDLFVLADTRVDIAHLKSTRQSSTKWYGSHLAVDGVLSQSLPVYPCTHTEFNMSEYWWAVDLGGIYTVDSITIYNREDCCETPVNVNEKVTSRKEEEGNRLYDYYIYMFSPTIPSWATYDTGERKLCFFHSGPSPSILNLSCDRKYDGRYIQVYKKFRAFNDSDVLTLCEFQAFAYQKEGVSRFCKSMLKKPILHIYSKSKMTAGSCGATCSVHKNCIGFRLTEDKTCDLYQTSMTVDIVDNDSNYYEKC